MGIDELENQVNDFIENRASLTEIYELLYLCVLNKSSRALSLVIGMARADYDGFTYNLQLKYPAIASSLYWEEDGIERISSMAIDIQKSKVVTPVCEVLSLAIKGNLKNMLFVEKNTTLYTTLDFSNEKYYTAKFKSKAKESLINVFVNLNKDISLPISVLNSVL